MALRRQLFLLALLPAVAVAFMGRVPLSRPTGMRMMSDVLNKPTPVTTAFSTPTPGGPTSSGSALVPVNPKNVETSAGVVGAAGGVLLFGPVVGAILGLLANYAAKSDNELGEAARGVGKTALELLNYLNKVNSKYEITNKVGDATGKLYSRIKENEGDDSVILKLEETVSTTKTKLADLDTQYQLVDKAKSAVVLAVDLSGAAVEKAVELNEKYSLVDKATEAAKDAAKKVKESIDKA